MVCVIHIYRLDYLDVGLKWHVCMGHFSHGLRVQGLVYTVDERGTVMKILVYFSCVLPEFLAVTL